MYVFLDPRFGCYEGVKKWLNEQNCEYHWRGTHNFPENVTNYRVNVLLLKQLEVSLSALGSYSWRGVIVTFIF